MANESNSPFGMPGLGQAFGAGGNNPLVASLEMMRHAMSGMTASAGGTSDPLAPPLTAEDLERRINDLKVVENWLKLNLSMLTSSIQGLEVQLATIRTLRSFVAMGGKPTGQPHEGPSPLELVLGLKPSSANTTKASVPSSDQSTAADPSGQTPTEPSEQSAAQAWWKMLENQFSQIAAATAVATQAGTHKTAAPTPKKAAKRASKKSTPHSR